MCRKHVLLAISLKNTLGLQVLLKAGVDPNELSEDYPTTPLLYAIKTRYIEGIRLLLQYSHTNNLAPEVIKMLVGILFSGKKHTSHSDLKTDI